MTVNSSTNYFFIAFPESTNQALIFDTAIAGISASRVPVDFTDLKKTSVRRTPPSAALPTHPPTHVPSSPARFEERFCFPSVSRRNNFVTLVLVFIFLISALFRETTQNRERC